MSAGTMIELAAARDDIDTTDHLDVFEAYQKVFVVNGTKLKIADFVNTKLTVADALTTAPTRGSIVTQATSNATMVVDFVNTAKTMIYGKTTAGTFVTTGGYTLSGGSMDPTTRVPSAVAQATTTPHWYDLTVYPDDASGSLPSPVYLGCLYRGRITLSGNSNYPHQWYMSRQADHTDWAYIANDAQSPVSGSNADAGEVGDIIRCLIPYNDDYLIFGCANSIWALSGDAAEGGSLNAIDGTVGIFGPRSWCYDSDGNLYFWGTGGIYRIARGFGPVECLTQISLPDLVEDEAPDPSTHRITMAYDRKRYGILISVTKLSDGTSSGYWFSLVKETMGFYPESYPTVCGPYSAVYYDATDKTYRDLLVGCKDGYIRKFDGSATNDDSGASDTAISSYVTLGPFQLANGDKEGVITAISGFTTGGSSGGTEGDSDDITYKIFSGRTAGDTIEKLVANSSPKVSGTLSAPGRPHGGKKRKKVRGVFAALRLENTTASETMSFDRLIVDASEKGRIK